MIQETNAPLRGAFRIVVPALILAGVSSAASAADEVQAELPSITVSAHAANTVAYNQTGASVTVLDIPELREAGIYTAADALTTVPGVYNLSGGGENQRGNICNVVIRGLSSGDSFMPMIDGMRLSGLSGSGILSSNVMARTNLFDLGTMEVLRGAQGATYGGTSMSGVVYMETPKGDSDKPAFSLFNEGGSHDSYTGNVTTQGEKDDLAWFLSSTYEHTNNDITLADGRSMPGKHAGRYEIFAQAMRLDYKVNEDATVTATYRREDASYHYGSLYGVSPYTFRSNMVTAKGEVKLNHAWKSSLMAGFYGSDYMLGHGWYSDLRNVQVEWRNAYKWDKKNTTTAGMSWIRNQYDVSSVYETSDRNTNNNLDNTYGLFAEHLYKPRKGWENSLALRCDQSNNFDSLINARLASSYRFNKDKTRLFGSVGQSYRAPSSFQHSNSVYYGSDYGYGPTIYRGNPDIDCSTAVSADLGIEHDFAEDHTLTVTLFHTRVEDAIETVFTGDGYTYGNASGHQTAQGVEAAITGKWENHWDTGYKLACTLTSPKTSDGRQIPASARQTWTGDIHTSPLEGLTTGIGLTAAAGRSNFAGNTVATRLDSFYSLRWYARYKVNDNLTLHARVENLTNQKYIIESAWDQAANSIICAGISVHGGCTLTF